MKTSKIKTVSREHNQN